MRIAFVRLTLGVGIPALELWSAHEALTRGNTVLAAILVAFAIHTAVMYDGVARSL